MLALGPFGGAAGMPDCCSGSRAGQRPCPVSGQLCAVVSRRTVLHHLQAPWSREVREQDYYFCDDPGCPVVYFDRDASTITAEALRTEVGVKALGLDATLCYCFGISFGAAADNPAIREFVVEQTQQGICACEARNPSGRCCLRDFPTR